MKHVLISSIKPTGKYVVRRKDREDQQFDSFEALMIETKKPGYVEVYDPEGELVFTKGSPSDP